MNRGSASANGVDHSLGLDDYGIDIFVDADSS